MCDVDDEIRAVQQELNDANELLNTYRSVPSRSADHEEQQQQQPAQPLPTDHDAQPGPLPPSIPPLSLPIATNPPGHGSSQWSLSSRLDTALRDRDRLRKERQRVRDEWLKQVRAQSVREERLRARQRELTAAMGELEKKRWAAVERGRREEARLQSKLARLRRERRVEGAAASDQGDPSQSDQHQQHQQGHDEQKRRLEEELRANEAALAEMRQAHTRQQEERQEQLRTVQKNIEARMGKVRSAESFLTQLRCEHAIVGRQMELMEAVRNTQLPQEFAEKTKVLARAILRTRDGIEEATAAMRELQSTANDADDRDDELAHLATTLERRRGQLTHLESQLSELESDRAQQEQLITDWLATARTQRDKIATSFPIHSQRLRGLTGNEVAGECGTLQEASTASLRGLEGLRERLEGEGREANGRFEDQQGEMEAVIGQIRSSIAQEAQQQQQQQQEAPPAPPRRPLSRQKIQTSVKTLCSRSVRSTSMSDDSRPSSALCAAIQQCRDDLRRCQDGTKDAIKALNDEEAQLRDALAQVDKALRHEGGARRRECEKDGRLEDLDLQLQEVEAQLTSLNPSVSLPASHRPPRSSRSSHQPSSRPSAAPSPFPPLSALFHPGINSDFATFLSSVYLLLADEGVPVLVDTSSRGGSISSSSSSSSSVEWSERRLHLSRDLRRLSWGGESFWLVDSLERVYVPQSVRRLVEAASLDAAARPVIREVGSAIDGARVTTARRREGEPRAAYRVQLHCRSHAPVWLATDAMSDFHIVTRAIKALLAAVGRGGGDGNPGRFQEGPRLDEYRLLVDRALLQARMVTMVPPLREGEGEGEGERSGSN
ncbi:unnamed protein product [Vitrella brassicaformis CCMP3155]|uniref:Uncharacterized protein n=1 Tax=Vitrella brassicaformis (strain CCMP3155) TaxID=1169540 RepID=A0A0G4E8S8_VITBC|nr:unnamed protein product [Vitrella brassicaformis CCMP3155]|eukprot:CEL91606.1 unnamed protein product [Vitrella brassicaformis CCMP3155]